MAEQLALERTKAALEPAASTASIIQMAVQQGAGIDVLERLMALKEREDAAQAKRAFDQALADFKASPPTIDKNREVSFGNTNYKHATLDHVAKILLDSLSKHGLVYTWEQKQDGPSITVTCILSHIHGHRITNSLTASADTSGSKNAIQAIASAVTYLRRYTLLGVLGMAEAGQDDDAATAAPRMDEGTLLEWLDAINQADDLKALQHVYSEAYKAAQHMQDRNAMGQLVAAKDARKKVLSAAH